MVPMDTKLGRMVAYLVGLLTIQSFSVVLQGHGTNDKHMSPTRVPVVKLGRMITYLDGLLPITSLDPLITWSCEIM